MRTAHFHLASRFEQLRMRAYLGRDMYRAILAVVDWVRTIADDTTVVRIEFPHYTASFQFLFPLRAHDLPRRIWKNAENPSFIIRAPASLPEGEWARMFRSPDLEVLEKRRHLQKELMPLRFGLSLEESAFALKFARETMNDVFEKKPVVYSWNVPPRFLLSVDVNVAIWVGGALRGSQIVEHRSLKDGLEEAARRTLVDSRFKPLVREEFQQARIQIGLISPLRVPLSDTIRERNRILPEKGFFLSLKEKNGWFLPEVLNVRGFRGLDDFIVKLAEEKAGIDATSQRSTGVKIFEVDDFIESEDHARPIRLHGSMPAPVLSATDRNVRFRAAADWLVSLQEADGNIPPIVNPLTGRQTQIDWPRLAFSAWALAEFGKAMQKHAYTASAQKSFTFLRTYLLDTERAIPNRELSLAYFGRLAHALDHGLEARSAASLLTVNASQLAFDAIAFAQIAGFLRLIHSQESGDVTVMLEQTLKKTFLDLRQKKTPMSLAAWAELAPLFKESDPVFSQEVYQWLLSLQLENGAFPDTTTSDFVYTRGTGKIFEALTYAGNEYKDPIEKALAWLFSMQYTPENMFFISPDMRPRMIGSFRHDYTNQEAWIDSAGHMLLARARLKNES